MASTTPQAVGNRYKLVFTVPPTHLELTKAAVFAVGAGVWHNGKYTQTCNETPVTGQFLCGETSNPHIGSVGTLERVEEIRVETICVGRSVIEKAVDALKSSHPYEEPGYEVYKLEDF